MERLNPLMPSLPPEIPTLHWASAKEGNEMVMKHMENPMIVVTIFLGKGRTLIDLISESPFLHTIDDPGMGIVYI